MHLRENGTQSFIDDFYFARAELLLGNHDSAANYFAKLQTSIEKYEAKKRFDFEVAMACELGGSNLLDLGRFASKISINTSQFPTSDNPQTKGLENIVSISPSMQQIKEEIIRFSNLDLPVLITGETGTGKELVAKFLHDLSSRSNKRFIAINCSAIPDALIESEFFGHTHGSFTGAKSAYAGIFREAGEGTVFLHEIADISPQLQISLLRVLETGDVRPVGSTALYKIKCRIIAATNQPLTQLVKDGKFRNDLYYRLQRLEIQLPPLRNRSNDIEKLAKYFFDTERSIGENVSLSSDLIKTFEQYNWPENVRELRNIIQRMRIMNSDKLFYDLSDLHRCEYQLGPSQEETPNDIHSSLVTTTGRSVAEGNSTFRRKRRLRELFDEYHELRVSEVAELLSITTHTASRYLVELNQEGLIEKICPTSSTKSIYYVKKQLSEN